MKIALLIAGELREFQTAKNFWPFLKIPDLDIYLSTWATSVKDDPVNNERITEIVEATTLANSLNFKKIIIEDLPGANSWGIHLYLYKIRNLIENVLAENIVYDIIIVIRPDLIFTVFPQCDLVDHILDKVKYDDIIHTITNNWKIADTKLTTDVLFVGTPNTFKKFLTFIPKLSLDVIPNLDLVDIHSFLGKSYLDNGIEVDNLPIYKWTIARPNSRGKVNPTFEILENDAKIHWEYRYKKFFSSTENLYLGLNVKDPIEYPKIESNKKINLFDEFDYDELPEANKEFNWYSTDNHDNFEKGFLEKKHKYTQNDIIYRFNSLGFRIPESRYPLKFDDAYGYPTFMVAGCSFTEGVALPEDSLWHSYLIEKFIQNNDTRRPIAKLNLGKAGFGIDAIVRYIYISIERYGARPDLIYLLLPTIFRKELILDDMHEYKNPSTFLLLPNVPIPDSYPKGKKQNIEMNLKLMLNTREAYYRAFQSLLFLKYYLEQKKIPWFFSSWSTDFNVQGIKEYFPNIDITNTNIPEVLDQHHININFLLFNPGGEYHMARDGMHVGAEFHRNFSNQVYEKIVNSSMFLEVRNKWKT